MTHPHGHPRHVQTVLQELQDVDTFAVGWQIAAPATINGILTKAKSRIGDARQEYQVHIPLLDTLSLTDRSRCR